MFRYIAKRLLHAIPLVLGIVFLGFFIADLAPGDFLTVYRSNPEISGEMLEQMREQFGLDRHWVVQYLLWLRNVVFHLNFGQSFKYRVPVYSLIGFRLFNTFILAGSSMLIAWLVAVPLGVISAVKQYSWLDKICSAVVFLGISVPSLFLALLFVLFAHKTGWFDTGGMHGVEFTIFGDGWTWWMRTRDVLWHLMLPALVLSLPAMAGLMRQMRGNLLDTLRSQFVLTARAKGLGEGKVIGWHAFRNAVNPLITLFGYSLAGLLSGSFIVEYIFGWPGLGRLTLDALMSQDLYLMIAGLLMSSVLLILGNLAADLLLSINDPRIRLGA